MARGWESKDVEAQLEARESERARAAKARQVAEQNEHERRRESLLLSRIRVTRDLEAAQHPRHKQQIQAALTHLESELAKLA